MLILLFFQLLFSAAFATEEAGTCDFRTFRSSYVRFLDRLDSVHRNTELKSALLEQQNGFVRKGAVLTYLGNVLASVDVALVFYALSAPVVTAVSGTGLMVPAAISAVPRFGAMVAARGMGPSGAAMFRAQFMRHYAKVSLFARIGTIGAEVAYGAQTGREEIGNFREDIQKLVDGIDLTLGKFRASHVEIGKKEQETVERIRKEDRWYLLGWADLAEMKAIALATQAHLELYKLEAGYLQEALDNLSRLCLKGR